MSDSHHPTEEHHEHHILSGALGLKVLIALLILTVITVAASRVDMGILNFPVAMLIASVKAFVVMLFFMGLKYDTNENRAIFVSGFVFFGIFIALTASDEWARSNVTKATGPIIEAAGGGEPLTKFAKATPDVLKQGKTLYSEQCAICHGDAGLGNGVAGAALNPPPRNFTKAEGWKNGRTIPGVYQTLTKGLNLMPAFAQLSPQQRLAVGHYALSLGGAVPEASDEDFKKVGLDMSKSDGGGTAQKALPIEFAIDRYLEKSGK